MSDLIRQARQSDQPEAILATTSTLIPVRPGNSRTPLFLIHDVNGSVLRYEHLARHFPEGQAVYAIEPTAMRGLPADYSVEAMAQHYIEQIRERQPKGPYYVAGHSFGGSVAYEIARQLTAQNEAMGLVGLFDTFQEGVIEGDEMLQETKYRRGFSGYLKLLLNKCAT